MSANYRIDVNEVRSAAVGRWPSILAVLAPQLEAAMERPGKHVDCPIHGGKGDFRLFKNFDLAGSAICTCGHWSNGFDLLQELNQWPFYTALKEVHAVLGGSAPEQLSRPVLKPGSKPSSARKDRRLVAAAHRILHDCVPFTDKSAWPAWRYVRNRGLPSAVDSMNLFFHPSLIYFDEDGRRRGRYPALVARVLDREGQLITLHRTYLNHRGAKADVPSPKKVLPIPSHQSLLDGRIELATAGEELGVAEGIENAWAARALFGVPCWSCVNAEVMANFVCPPTVKKLHIFADRNRPTKHHPMGHGQEAARRLAKASMERGIVPVMHLPPGPIPDGQKDLDWLDVLRVSFGRSA